MPLLKIPATGPLRALINAAAVRGWFRSDELQSTDDLAKAELLGEYCMRGANDYRLYDGVRHTVLREMSAEQVRAELDRIARPDEVSGVLRQLIDGTVRVHRLSYAERLTLKRLYIELAGAPAYKLPSLKEMP